MIVTFCGHSSMPNKPEVTLKMETVLRNLFETNQVLLFYCGDMANLIRYQPRVSNLYERTTPTYIAKKSL